MVSVIVPHWYSSFDVDTAPVGSFRFLALDGTDNADASVVSSCHRNCTSPIPAIERADTRMIKVLLAGSCLGSHGNVCV